MQLFPISIVSAESEQASLTKIRGYIVTLGVQTQSDLPLHIHLHQVLNSVSCAFETASILVMIKKCYYDTSLFIRDQVNN